MSGTAGSAGVGDASGMGGASGNAGVGGASDAGGGPVASAGCNKAPGPVVDRQVAVDTYTGIYIVSLPAQYDRTKPYALGFGFHGRDQTHTQCRDSTCKGFQSVMKDQAVLVYMKALRKPVDSPLGGWESSTERDGNAKFFELVLAQVKADYCVDERRVFVAGTSSGASFSNLLGCRYGDKLLAVAPVSGSLPENQNCKGAPAALVIHGIDDSHVPFASGQMARDNYLQRSQCTSTTVPLLSDMHADVRAKRDAMPSVQVAECVDYQGCRASSPVRWCEHSYGGYDNTTHGWPPVGGQMIWDFVKSL